MLKQKIPVALNVSPFFSRLIVVDVFLRTSHNLNLRTKTKTAIQRHYFDFYKEFGKKHFLLCNL